MRTENIENANILTECYNNAVKNNNICLFPGCTNISIDSHILQKNGILSSIAKEKHLWEFKVDHYKDPYIEFKRKGINKIYTFKGFCSIHDNNIFKKIESNELQFEDYKTNLLFALRTLYNEVWLKRVATKFLICIVERDKNNVNFELLKAIEQSILGLEDLEKVEKDMWNDLNENFESFIFKYRKINKEEICLNALFTYDTSQEIIDYIKKNGKNIERLSEVFIAFFPYRNESILLLGYHKSDTIKVKKYVDEFLICSYEALQIKITNMVLFNCETWVCSDQFYEDKIKGYEELFYKATQFMSDFGNERIEFHLNIFNSKFKKEFQEWIKKYIV